MGTAKAVLAVILALLGVLALISLFLPSAIHVEKARLIKAEQEAVFDLVNDLKNWEHWSPWHEIDTETKWTFSDSTSGTGAWYSWESEKQSVGKGHLKIIESQPGRLIRTAMDFGPNGTAESIFYFDTVPGGVQVKWVMESPIGKNPVGKYMGLIMRGMIGSSYKQGLANMEEYLSRKESGE